MSYNKEIKQERSVPVQSRIDIVSLAKIAKYWETKCEIRTMSQLVSWSIDLLMEVLDNNNVIEIDDMNIADARNYLSSKGLIQKSMNKKGIRKIATSMAFESLRDEGVDPKEYTEKQYTILHNKGSVKPYNGEVSNREVEAAKKLIARARANKEKMNNYDPIQAAKDSGMKVVGNNEGGIKKGMSNEELNAYDVERERKIREMENAPVDVSMFNVVKE